MLLAVVPAVGWVLSIAGGIMVLIAIKYISEIVQDGSIFTNMILAVVLGIVGVVVGAVVIVGAVFAKLGLRAFTGAFPGYSTPSAIPAGDWVGLILGALAGLAVIWVLLLVSAIFVRKSYGSIAKKLGVGMFGTAGLLYLIGAALTIILVGFVLLFVAVILNIVAFFSIPDQLPAQPMAQPPPPAMA
jgi:uncharacterized membrane protein